MTLILKCKLYNPFEHIKLIQRISTDFEDGTEIQSLLQWTGEIGRRRANSDSCCHNTNHYTT